MGVMAFEGKFVVFTATFDPASVGAATSAEQALTVPGLLATDQVLSGVPGAALNAGLAIGGFRVSAANTLQIRLINATAGALDAASSTWTFTVFRPERIYPGFTMP